MRKIVLAVIGAATLLTTTTAVATAMTANAATADPPAPSRPSRPSAAPARSGWRWAGADGRTLTWVADHPIPITDAAVRFFAGTRSLGVAVEAKDRRTFRLHVDPAPDLRDLADLHDLRADASGRRLDPPVARRAVPTGPALASPGSASGPPSSAPASPGPAGGSGAAALLPANAVDPGLAGRYPTSSGEYSLPDVALPGLSAKVEMKAVVVGPTTAKGPVPVVVLLHGRHATCYSGPADADLTGDWPCAAGATPVPSYRGYLRAQQLLASQGYLTVSISANGINAQDHSLADGGAEMRSSLIRIHLSHWADWAADRGAAPAIVRSLPAADLSRVLVMGHSRGGEGANMAAIDTVDPPPALVAGYHGAARWRIRGTVLVGPTAFGQNPAPDVPSLTVLPGCDGDVSDLEGQLYADATRGVSRGAALHAVVYVIGANHNYFNTEWTPGQSVASSADDADPTDPICGAGAASRRLTGEQESTVGATYLAAAARLFLAGDDRVRPLLDGSGTRAPSADPARVLSAAVGAGRTPLVLPATDTEVTGAGRICRETETTAAAGCLTTESVTSPHFVQFAVPEPDRVAVALSMSPTATPVVVRPRAAGSLADATEVALRVVVPPGSTGDRVTAAVTDDAGRTAVLGTAVADGLPATAASYWAQELRLPLTAARSAHLNLSRITGLSLTVHGAGGNAFLIDAWGWRPGTPDPATAPLLRVDLGKRTVKEGDSGTRSYTVPIVFTGRGTGTVRLYSNGITTGGARSGDADTTPFTVTEQTITARPGSSATGPKVNVTGDELYGDDQYEFMNGKAVTGAVFGQFAGQVTVSDDDPQPSGAVVTVAGQVTEGSVTGRS